MRNYHVFQLSHVDSYGTPVLKKVATVTAASATHALRIAKQKNIFLPIVGVAE